MASHQTTDYSSIQQEQDELLRGLKAAVYKRQWTTTEDTKWWLTIEEISRMYGDFRDFITTLRNNVDAAEFDAAKFDLTFTKDIYWVLADQGVENVSSIVNESTLETARNIMLAMCCPPHELNRMYSQMGGISGSTRSMIRYALTSPDAAAVASFIQERKPADFDEFMEMTANRSTLHVSIQNGSL